MDSSFISHQQKVKYCAEILNIKPEATKSVKKEFPDVRLGSADPYYAYRQKIRSQVTYILSISTAGMVLITTLTIIDGASFNSLEGVLPLVATASLVPVVGTIILNLKRQEELRRQRLKENLEQTSQQSSKNKR